MTVTTMAVSGTDQVIGLVINGLVMALLALAVWLVRKAATGIAHLIDKVEHIDQCMDGVKAASEADRLELKQHRLEAAGRDRKIADMDARYAGLEGWVKGRFGLPIDAPVTEIKDAKEV